MKLKLLFSLALTVNLCVFGQNEIARMSSLIMRQGQYPQKTNLNRKVEREALVGLKSTAVFSNKVLGINDAGIFNIISPAGTVCAGVISPVITLENFGSATLTSVTINYNLDGGSNQAYNWTGSLTTNATVQVSLPGIIVSTGAHTFKAATYNPNGANDEQTGNDASTGSFTVSAGGIAAPFTQNFESTSPWPYTGYTVSNPDGGIGWAMATVGHSGSKSLFMRNYDYAQNGQVDEVILPAIDLSAAGAGSTASFKFWLAYQAYANLATAGAARDTLVVLVSTDCGASWANVYKKYGSTLVTANPQFANAAFSPKATDWRQETLDITPYIGLNSVMFKFRNINNYENDLYIDDINIDFAMPVGVNDAGTLNIISPTGTICANSISPVITLKNYGSAALSSVTINYNIDGGSNYTYNWTGNLATNATTQVNLPGIVISGGAHTINAATYNPNGLTDVQTGNDASTGTFTATAGGSATPLVQDFEGAATWPYTGYTVNNPDGGIGWAMATVGHSGSKSLFMRDYDYTQTGEVDELILPAADMSGATNTASFKFWLAYQTYNNPNITGNGWDTLNIMVSTDCGTSWTSIYKKYGSTLVTATPQFSANAFSPGAADWRKETVDITPYIGQSSVILKFKHTNNNENNLYIDDMNIDFSGPLGANDAGTLNITSPVGSVCGNSISPVFTLKNFGSAALTSVTINYNIDGGSNYTYNWTGNLATNTTAQVSLPGIMVSSGTHTINIATYNPNGTTDVQTGNDAATGSFTAVTGGVAPISQDFESTSPWPYTGYTVSNPDGGIGWAMATVGHSGSKSLFMRNYNYTQNGQVDELILPAVDMSGAGGVAAFKFWLAYQARTNPSTSGVARDTLNILVSTDCGVNWTNVYQKYGSGLVTASTLFSSTAFTPGLNDWRKESVDLSSYIGQNAVILKFKHINNHENNLYIDDIKVDFSVGISGFNSSDNAFRIYPNPGNGRLFINFYKATAEKTIINVLNLLGEKVNTYSISSPILNTELDLIHLNSGVYFIELINNGQSFVQRLVIEK